MAEPKTKLTQVPVEDFLNAIQDDQIRQDCWIITEMMQKAANATPQMWGPSIIGFGSYHYKYAGGREADWPLIAFSPRKQNITLYTMSGFEHYEELMAQLGKHTNGKGCLYIKRLDQVHIPTLEKIIQASVEHRKKTNPAE